MNERHGMPTALHVDSPGCGPCDLVDYIPPRKSHVGFDWPWMFYIALKSKASQSDWFSSEARLNYEMQKRSIPTVDGDSPFHYFDSSTMLSFQFPHRGSEVSFCRRHPTPPGCDMGRGFDPEIQNVPLSQLFVANKSDMAGEEDDVGSEHRVITKAVVPRHSYLGLESSVHQVRFESDTLNLIHEQDGHKLLSGNAVADFVQKYGITSNFRVRFPFRANWSFSIISLTICHRYHYTFRGKKYRLPVRMS